MLSMMGELLIKVLSKDGIDDKLKSFREDFLDNLEVRICYIPYLLLILLYSKQDLHRVNTGFNMILWMGIFDQKHILCLIFVGTSA